MAYGTAVQIGNQIVITSQYGGVTRSIEGRLISYINGHLKYLNMYGSYSESYIGI